MIIKDLFPIILSYIKQNNMLLLQETNVKLYHQIRKYVVKYQYYQIYPTANIINLFIQNRDILCRCLYCNNDKYIID